MNSFIEALNQWSGNFLSFAWPMLWQSSVLIAVLFVVDLLFRRKLRASIRYALWLVVLVKLCAPPTLALPTSPAWWLHKTPPPVVAKSLPHYTVTYDNGPLPEIPQTSLAIVVPPRPVMTNAAWLLVVSIVIGSVLLLWLLVRWWQITRMVRRAAASERLTSISDEAQRFIGMGLKVQVKLTSNSVSPAVSGLFRPAILIPQSLAENFTDEQLRAVLLHELIHLRRRDVWVNFLQALLQIVYWWHPLVWLANARIRRVREEAVDDAVMLALRDEAEAYAPTLLEVAKLALNRPLASLGLVGIMESRHALRQRIERLVDFRAPRRAGLTLVSVLGVLAFTAVAVPMGDGPSPEEKPVLPAATVSKPPDAIQITNQPAILIQAEFYQMRPANFKILVSDLRHHEGGVTEDAWWSASPEQFSKFQKDLKQSGLKPFMRPRIQTSSGVPASMYVGDGTNGLMLDCSPFFTGALVDLAIQGKVIDSPAKATITNQFNAKTSVENYGGIVIRVEKLDGFTVSNLVVVTGVQLVTNLVGGGRPAASSTATPTKTMTFKLDHPISFDELKEKLLAAGVRIPATVFYYKDDGRLLARGSEEQLALVNRLVLQLNGYSLKETEASNRQFIKEIGDLGFENSSTSPMTNLLSRHFKVDANGFVAASRKASGLQTDNVPTMARNFFGKLGVDLDLPGKSVFYNDGLGELFVRATKSDMDVIEQALQVLISAPPQIHIKARFLEVPKGTLVALGNVIPVPNQPAQSNQVAGLVGILTDKNFRTVLRNLEARPGVEALAEPEVVTTSGRQTQMRATKTIITVVTNFVFEENATNGVASIISQSSQIETGPVLDVIPYVLSDGDTINLTVIPSLTKFLGYDAPAPTNTTTTYDRAGEKIDLPKSLPRFTVRQVVATLNLWDNQTAIISGLPAKDYVNGKEVADKPKAGDKELLVFITATIVDPAGNRVHADDELPFAKTGVPAQPAQLPPPPR